MGDLHLKIGCSRYDHAQALYDGSIKFDGVEATYESAPVVSSLFERMVRDRAFDVCEMGMTVYLRTLDFDDPPFIALPVFLARLFRHSDIFVNVASGIRRPEDLAGRMIGEIGTYGHDGGIWSKGILADDYGVTPDQCRWLIGGPDKPTPPFDFVPFIHPMDVAVQVAPKDKALGPMLEAGEIDALISATVPQCILNKSPRVAQLFPDYQAVERDYYRRTGIFPIMHTVLVKKELLSANPGLARSLYDGFGAAKEAAMQHYLHGRLEQHRT